MCFEGDEESGTNNNKQAIEAGVAGDYELATFVSSQNSGDLDEFGMYLFSQPVFVCFSFIVEHFVLSCLLSCVFICSCHVSVSRVFPCAVAG